MSSENTPFSRRDLVKSVGTGIAGAALSGTLSSAEAQTPGAASFALFLDRKGKYPTPPRILGKYSLGLAWRARWIPVLIMARRATKARAGS
jgi:hypothetical protein